jgi:protoporphyrinogen oxidase
MGIWSEGRLWDFGTPLSLLRFRPLPWPGKLRFALSTLVLQRTADRTPFEDVTAREWLLEHQGEDAWRTIWEPLLHQKFGDRADEIAMVWLWRKLSLRGRSRSTSGMGERLGYMNGSFARLTDRLVEAIQAAGSAVRTADPVRRLDAGPKGTFTVCSRSGEHRAKAVLVTTPVEEYLRIAGHLLPEKEKQAAGSLQSTAALCTVLELDRPFSGYYWLNIADRGFPFGGLIEHTNYVSRERYGGRHILYVSNYLYRNDPMFAAPADVVLARYIPALQRINPSFEPGWILRHHHFRAASAQPVVVPGSSRNIPPIRSAVRGLYLSCMAQIYPEDRGQNYAVVWGEKAARAIEADLS